MHLTGGWEMNKNDKYFILQFTEYFSYASFFIPCNGLVRSRNYLQFKAGGPETQSLWKVTELVNGETLFGSKFFALKKSCVCIANAQVR